MKKILIIEDDRILLETAADYLHDEGYEILKASDGNKGIRMAGENLPDLILCDISMPTTDGYQVFTTLQASFTTARIPFIFMTGRSDNEDIRYGMQLGADDYIIKPINFRELKKSIEIRLEKADKIIRKSEAKYHALFQLAKDAILVISLKDGRILDANCSSLEMLGFRKEELLATSGYSAISGSEFPAGGGYWESGQIVETEWLSCTGKKIPVQVRGTTVDVDGETTGLLIARDIREILEKEAALRESEDKYRDLVENTGEGLGSVDPEERFNYANPAACEIFGLPLEKLVGSTLFDFLEPASVEEVNRQTALRKEGQRSMYELEIIRPDKEKRWIILTATPQYNTDGTFNGTFGIFRDITKRKLTEAKLQESERRLREIVDLTNDWIWEIDPLWRYSYVSPKIVDILGYSVEEMIGKSPFEFLPAEEVSGIKDTLRHYVHQFKPLNAIETKAIHKSGKIVYLETSGVPMFNEKGEYLGYRGADRDITLRKLYENELIISKEKAEESDKLKSSILANISHELRTPLNGILGFAEILKEELKESEYDAMAANIHSSGLRLMATLNSIITLSQLESGKVTLSVKPMKLEQGLISVVRSLESYAAEKHNRINTAGIKSLTIQSDEHLIKQLFRQILDNAIKFTEGGVISIETDQITEDHIRWHLIKVADTGIGIDKKYFDIIFQEFRQVSEGFGRQYQGSGIGLTISKKIIDLLEGKITLDSSEGIGSTFMIWLPEAMMGTANARQPALLSTNDNPPEVPVHAAEQPSKVNQGSDLPAVLLVEDNQVNTDLTRFFLRKYYQLDSAPDATTALEMIKKRNYVAILMDINLGHGMNGLEAAKEVKKHENYQNVPIIAVTGYTLHEEREKFFAEGCTHYIAKPFDQAGLLALLAEAIQH